MTTASRLKGRNLKDAADLRNSIKSKGSADGLWRVSADTTATIYILADPDAGLWYEYWEHYNEEYNFFPCAEGDCPGCDEGRTPSKKYAIPVVDMDQSRTRIISVTGGVAEKLYKKYDKFHTLMDRTYEITREGSGKNDTSYEVDHNEPLARSQRKMVQKFLDEIPDAEETVAASLPKDEDDDFPPPRSKNKKRTTGAKRPSLPKQRRPVHDDDDDDDDEPAFARKKPAKKPAKKTLLKKRR